MAAEAGDISAEALNQALPGRDISFYPTMVSTEADALSRARAGAPEGSLVVAEYQISARSRPRRPWTNAQGTSLSCSLILRPAVAPLRGGWLYLVATAALADILGEEAVIDWPDEVWRNDEVAGRVSIHLEATVRGLEWAVVNVMLPVADPPRTALLVRIVDAIESRYRVPPPEMLEHWLTRSRTIGRTVRAVLYPIGAGREVTGVAVTARPNGTLVLDVNGRQEGIRPHEVSSVDDVRTPAGG